MSAPETPRTHGFCGAEVEIQIGELDWVYTPCDLPAWHSGELARNVYPDLLLGLYDPDEIEAAPTARLARVASEPKTVTPDGEVIERSRSAAEVIDRAVEKMIYGFRARIGECTTREELHRLGREIGKSGLPKTAREDLQAAYVGAMRRASAPPPVEDAEQMRAAKEAADAAFEQEVSQ